MDDEWDAKKKKSRCTAGHKKENVHNEGWNTVVAADFYYFFWFGEDFS